MSTTRQDQEFIKALSVDNWLEIAVDWIGRNLDPEEVFSTRQLNDWAETNDYKKE